MCKLGFLTSLMVMIAFTSSHAVAQYTPPTQPEDSAIFAKSYNPLRFGDRHIVAPMHLPDSVDVKRATQNHFWRAAAETFGFNIGLWAFDRYVLDGHYARISWNSIKENFRHGFEWDDDHLHTNMFDHPYNGSIFFNAGRSNGFNFWQSELFAIGGSAMWEMFMECEYPSTNDIIATPIGGAAIGEVLYRASDIILDDRATGGKRFGRELAAFIVNPMRGINRIVSGQTWQRRATSGRQYGVPPISVDVSLGARLLTMWENSEGSVAGAAAKIKIEYGDRYAVNTAAPYDYFSFLIGVQGIKSQPVINRAEIIGRLLSKEIVDKNSVNLSVGMYQHFDFFDSDTIDSYKSTRTLSPCAVPYKLGAPASVGAGTMFRVKPHKSWSIDGNLHVNGILLGGVLTDFYRNYHRNYNWGSGFSLKAAVNWQFLNDRFMLRVANQLYRIYTWTGYDQNFDWSTTPEGAPVNIQGDNSIATFNHLETELNYLLTKRLYITAGADFFTRTTNYKDLRKQNAGTTTYYPIINSKQISLNLMLTYKFLPSSPLPNHPTKSARGPDRKSVV